MKNIVIAYLTCVCPTLCAQCLTAFEDTRGSGYENFYIYDNGLLVHQESQKIKSHMVGRNYVAYVDVADNFKIYMNGYTHVIQKTAPLEYHVTDYLLVYKNVGDQLSVFDGKSITYLGRLDPNIPYYTYGDSIVAYNDFYNTFNLFYNGSTTGFENRSVTQFGAKENIAAFVDPDFQYKILYNGEISVLESGSPPQSFKAHNNILAYVDFIGDFKIFLHGEVVTLQTQKPISYEVGEDMVAYVSGIDKKFMVNYEGENYELLPIPPKSYEVKHNVLVYTDEYNHFNVFYKGKSEKIAAYNPERYQIDRDIVVFTDLDNKLLGYFDGKLQEISLETVTQFWLVNKTVLFYKVPSNIKVYCDGVVNPLY